MFCDSFKAASLSLSPFDKIKNTEEKSRTLNFQRFHFLMEFISIESDIQHSSFEMKDPSSWLYFLYVNRPMQLFCHLTSKVYMQCISTGFVFSEILLYSNLGSFFALMIRILMNTLQSLLFDIRISCACTISRTNIKYVIQEALRKQSILLSFEIQNYLFLRT